MALSLAIRLLSGSPMVRNSSPDEVQRAAQASPQQMSVFSAGVPYRPPVVGLFGGFSAALAGFYGLGLAVRFRCSAHSPRDIRAAGCS